MGVASKILAGTAAAGCSAGSGPEAAGYPGRVYVPRAGEKKELTTNEHE